MVNTAFACLFTWGCKFEGKRGIYHLCLIFNLSLHFFCIKFALSKFDGNQIFRAVMVTIRNILNCVQPPRHTTPFFTQHGGMEDEIRFPEYLAMANVSLSWHKVIFISGGNISIGTNHRLGCFCRCKPWLFSWGFCAKLCISLCTASRGATELCI